MKTAPILYLSGLLLLGLGIAIATNSAAALPITVGGGLLLGGIVRYLEGK